MHLHTYIHTFRTDFSALLVKILVLSNESNTVVQLLKLSVIRFVNIIDNVVKMTLALLLPNSVRDTCHILEVTSELHNLVRSLHVCVCVCVSLFGLHDSPLSSTSGISIFT